MKTMKFLERFTQSIQEYNYQRSFIKDVKVQNNTVSIEFEKLDEMGNVEHGHFLDETYENNKQAINRLNEIIAFKDGTDSLEEKEEDKYQDLKITKFNAKWLILTLLQPLLVMIYIGFFIVSFLSTSVNDIWMDYKYSGLLFITILLYIHIYLMDKLSNNKETYREKLK